ncbi:MAG: acyl-CoA thioesterase [Holophagaceae bacterium]|nr:acyl-CoA thioesterase [Holophagaceae bacterium]
MAYTHSIEVRFRDLDALGHVNNAVLVTLIEQARYYWWQGWLGERPFEAEGFLIARIEVDYRRPIRLSDEVRVQLRCIRIGNTSFDLVYRVFRAQDQLLMAEARTVQVMLDFKTNRPTPILDATRAWLEGQA